MAVPYTFGSATSSIPLSQLDSNFATTITLGNTAIQLGNTVTTLNNMTLANVTVQSGNVTIGQANAVVYTNSSNVATANASAIAFDGTNLSVGATLSSWQTYKAIQMGAGSQVSYSTNDYRMVQNAFYSGGVWKYVANGYANLYLQDGLAGGHIWQSADSGTANGTISFTQVAAVEKGKSFALQGATPQTGTGITFPAAFNDSSNVNTLDDYEEGTWTPRIQNSSGSQYVDLANGSYTKIGRLVYVTIVYYSANISSITASSQLYLGNLPFSVVSSEPQCIFGNNPNNPISSVDGSGTAIPLYVPQNTVDYATCTRNTFSGTSYMSFRGVFTYKSS